MPIVEAGCALSRDFATFNVTDRDPEVCATCPLNGAQPEIQQRMYGVTDQQNGGIKRRLRPEERYQLAHTRHFRTYCTPDKAEDSATISTNKFRSLDELYGNVPCYGSTPNTAHNMPDINGSEMYSTQLTGRVSTEPTQAQLKELGRRMRGEP